MKRIVSTIIMLSFCLAAFAYGVSENQARSVAQRYFGLTQSSSGVSLVMSGLQSGTKAAADNPEFYVYNRDGGGFVIVSGENSIRPVLGYSDCGSFEEYSKLPDNVKWWMDCLAQSVNGLREENIIPDAQTLKEWDNVGQAQTRGEVYSKCLNTVQWTQYEPFDMLMPELGGYTCVTGCVPTAIAEIMCYYGYPEKASGHVDRYTVIYSGYGIRIYGGYDLGTEYNWTAMQKAVDESAAASLTDSEKQNMAQLIKDIGMCMQAQYSPSGTSASTSDIYDKICGPFGYNSSAPGEHRRFYSESGWEELLKSEIDKEHPILYDGADYENGGHCFVIDGYDSDNNFHINFGWGSWANGYFWIGEQFYGNQTAYIDFVPTSMASPHTAHLFLHDCCIGDQSGFIPSTTDIKAGSNFTMNVGYLCCTGGSYTGKVKLVREDKNGNYIEDISSEKSVTSLAVGNSVSFAFSCKVTAIGFGDRIAIYAKSNSETDFTRVSTALHGEGVEYYPLTPYSFINVQESYNVGDKFMLLLKNTRFPYLWDRGNQPYHTDWAFYCDGVLQDEVTDYASRFYEIPKAGTWMVKATVSDIDTGAVETVLCAQFTAR